MLERFFGIRHQQIAVKCENIAQPITAQAHALWTVEGKHLRRRRRKTKPATGARVVGRVNPILCSTLFRFGSSLFLAARRFAGELFFWRVRIDRARTGRCTVVGKLDDEGSFADFQCRFNGLSKTTANSRTRDQTINDNFDMVPTRSIKTNVSRKWNRVAVNANSGIATPLQFREKVLVFTFLCADNRSQNRVAGLIWISENAADDLIARLSLDRSITLRTESLADSRVQDAEEVVDLGDRSHGGTRIVARAFLGD